MTATTKEVPPAKNDEDVMDTDADFITLPLLHSDAMQTPASLPASEPSTSKKHRRDRKKDRHGPRDSKPHMHSYSHIVSTDNHNDADEPTTTPHSPTKKRRNSTSLDGSSHKRRKPRSDSHQTTDLPASVEVAGITEDADDYPAQESPSLARSRRRVQSGGARSRETSACAHDFDQDSISLYSSGSDIGNISHDVEAVAREAWQEHVNTQAALQRDVEVAESTSAAIDVTAEEATVSPRRGRSTRKKSKPTYYEQPNLDESLAAFREPHSPTAMTPKLRRVKGPRRQRKIAKETGVNNSDSPGAVKTYKQGKFSDYEIAKITRALDSFKAENDLEQHDVNEMIQAPGGTSAGEKHAQLWSRVFAECPDRHRQKVINTCRKKFHNFIARGTWTAEQDNELATLINVHSTKWSYIAGLINRHPEDLRDRYRNYLVCGAAQKKEAWDNNEEARLAKCVRDAMAVIDTARVEQPYRKDLRTKSYEELIDWQIVSEGMDRTRSRLQCITKWKSMNLRLVDGKDELVSAYPDSTISFRLEKARRQLEDMPDSEKYRLVLAISGSAAGAVSHIPWQRLCDKQFRITWHRSTQELIWHRLMLSVPGADTKTVRDCARYLIDKYDQEGDLPVISGEGWDDNDEMALMSQVPFGNREKEKEKQPTSSEKLTEEDMQDDEPTASVKESQEMQMQIDPALSDLPQPAKRATPAKRTQNGKRPSARKPRRAAE